MERRVWDDLRAGQSTPRIWNELREIQRDELSAAPHLMDFATQNATWQQAITIDGRFIAGCAVFEDDIAPGRGRGWFVGYAGRGLTSAHQIRPLIERWALFARLGPYQTLRAWVVAGAKREERFADFFGFRYECGTASGFSPAGRDMDLWIWRRGDGNFRRWGRRRGEGRPG